MGIYIYLSEQQRKDWRTVKDKELNELFQEALGHDMTLMISEETCEEKEHWWGKPVEKVYYTVYHEIFLKNGHPAYEAKHQIWGSGDRWVVLAYLCGIINGSLISYRT